MKWSSVIFKEWDKNCSSQLLEMGMGVHVGIVPDSTMVDAWNSSEYSLLSFTN